MIVVDEHDKSKSISHCRVNISSRFERINDEYKDNKFDLAWKIDPPKTRIPQIEPIKIHSSFYVITSVLSCNIIWINNPLCLLLHQL